jgi:hypothetical protein
MGKFKVGIKLEEKWLVCWNEDTQEGVFEDSSENALSLSVKKVNLYLDKMRASGERRGGGAVIPDKGF